MRYKIGDKVLFAKRSDSSYWFKRYYAPNQSVGTIYTIKSFRRKTYNNQDGQPSYYVEGYTDSVWFLETDLSPGYSSKIKLYGRIN